MAIEKYGKAVWNVGLWKSESILFEKYASKNSKIIDIGCGAGRTTFALYLAGYHNIIGVDISEKLIHEALKNNQYLKLNIRFFNMDIIKTPFKTNTFDVAFFSYNGLTGIPTQQRRLDILKEIYRILKPNGYFIFCAHDRDEDKDSKKFWLHEYERWKSGKNNPMLYEYGDVLVEQGKNYEFLHYYSHNEMIDFIHNTNFQIVESLNRKDIAREPCEVTKFSKETCFWILKK